jgi:hypothetical protein
MWRSDQPVRCSIKDLRHERHITESATLRMRFVAVQLRSHDGVSMDDPWQR